MNADHGTEQHSINVARADEINRLAATYWHDYGRHEHAEHYLHDRGVRSTPPEFIVGYAPVGGGLPDYLGSQEVSANEMIDAGVARELRGRLVDVFRDRLTIGMTDRDGYLRGFTARDIGGGDYPRYINTASSATFNKGQLLVGLHEGRTKLNQGATLVLTEGALDALAIAQFAGDYVPVSACGTAFRESHVQVLNDLAPAKRAVIAYDDDAAGRSAAAKSAESLMNAGWRVRVTGGARGLDPAEIAAKHGDKLLTWLNPAHCVPGLYHVVNEEVATAPKGTLDERVDAARTVLEHIEQYRHLPEFDLANRRVLELCGAAGATAVTGFSPARSTDRRPTGPVNRALNHSTSVVGEIVRN